MNQHILIIDADSLLTEQLTAFLKQEGFQISVAHDGESGIKKALSQVFQLIILDITLSQKNGFQVLKALREHSTIPVLFLTAKADDVDRLVAFELGADDYLVKPCNPNELVARMRAILNRSPKEPASRSVVNFNNISLDGAKRIAKVDNQELELTNTEFNILEMLLKAPDQAFSKEELTEYALGRKYTAYDRSIDVHISNLRSKLGQNNAGQNWIKTVRGFGYVFNTDKTYENPEVKAK